MDRPRASLQIGVDGGGSRCRAGIRWGGAGPVHLAEAGPANVTSDFDGAIRNVRAAIAAAAELAGASAEDVAGAAAQLGLAGMLDDSSAARVARALPIRRPSVCDDRAIQVIGALGARDGYLLAIGTGTIVARSTALAIRGVCGWGFAVSDQASGADLGRAALSRALLCHDGIERHSELTRALIADRFGSPGAVAAFAARAGPADFAALAPLVIEAGRAGDAQARAILAEGGAYLDRALHALGFEAGDRLCLAGGIGPNYRPYLDAARRARLAPPAGSALDGALRLADLASRDGTGAPA